MGYLGFLMSFFVWLRFYYDNVWGMVVFFFMVVVVKVFDVFVYLVGKIFG